MEENRILVAVRLTEEALGLKSQEELDLLAAVVGLSPMEYAKWQELKTLAVAEGKLSLAEGVEVYRMLGKQMGGPAGWPASTTLAEKLVVTRLMGQLVKQRLEG